MGLKGIFQEGMKEFKRRSALGKEKRNLKQSQKLHSQQLTTLGKKAWESQIDMDQYSNLEKMIASTQQQLDQLKNEKSALEKQKLQSEEKRKQENERFDAARQEVENKKKGVDDRLSEEKKRLKDSEKLSDSYRTRINRIADEEKKLNDRAADPDLSTIEKKDIPDQLANLKKERDELRTKIDEAEKNTRKINDAIVPVEKEIKALQQEIDKIKDEQKQVVGELDKSISQFKDQIDECEKKQANIDKEQNSNFQQLGEQVAASKESKPEVAAELDDVRDTEKEMALLQKKIEKLNAQATTQGNSAYKKMLGLTFAGIILIVALVLLVAWLLKPGNKSVTSANSNDTGSQVTQTMPSPSPSSDETASSQSTAPTVPPASMEEAMKKFNEMTGDLKKQSEAMQGKKIVVADKEILMAALPKLSGWEVKTPTYRKQKFGQLEGSYLAATYIGPDSQPVDIEITDTGHASAVLSPFFMMINTDMNHEDERGYEKITSYHDHKLIEKYEKKYNRWSLSYILKKRYLIHLKTTGDNGIDRLKPFIKELNVSPLQ